MSYCIECFRSFQFLEAQGLKRYSSMWEKADHTDIIDEFPILTEEEIVVNITLGKSVVFTIHT